MGKIAITTGLSLFLAAILGPRAFGVIAMALVFTHFIEMLQQQGMMPAIISRKVLRDEHADTAFWMVLGASLVCTAGGLIVAPWWASVNGLPELTLVIQVLALGIPLTSSVVVQESILRRHLQFRKLAIRSWSSVLAGGCAGVLGALLGWGVWALVAQQLVMNLTAVAVLWRVSPWRPRRQFSRQAATELWSYSMRSSSSAFGLFLGGRVDVILAGVLFGPVLVGLYRMGQRLTAMIVDVTARPMQSVSLPSLSILQDDLPEFTRRLVRMQRLTASLALPTLGVAFGMAPILEHILGDEWNGAATAIRILAISQAFSAVSLLLGPALQARGRPGTHSLLMWLWAALTAIALVGVAGLNLSGRQNALAALCIAIVAASGTSAMLLMIVVARSFSIPALTMLRAWGPGMAAGLTAALAAWAVGLLDVARPIVEATVAGAIGLALAVAVLATLDPIARAVLRRPTTLRARSG